MPRVSYSNSTSTKSTFTNVSCHFRFRHRITGSDLQAYFFSSMDPRRWIRDHDCWHFLSYTVQPFFRQSLGSLRMLGQRIRCQACQTIYQHFRKELANSVENNHPESTVDCSIVHYLGLDWQFHLGPVGRKDLVTTRYLVLTVHRLGQAPTRSIARPSTRSANYPMVLGR